MPPTRLSLLLILLLHQAPAAPNRPGAQGTTPSLPKLSDYTVPRTPQTHPHPPLLRTPKDRHFRSIIRDTAAEGPNFAGHYAIAFWGCGSGCAQFAIIDTSTGKVYDPAVEEIDYHYPPATADISWQHYPGSLTYAADSRLLILEGCLDGKRCGRNYYVMESTGLRHLAYDPDLLPDGSVAPF